MTPIGYMYKKVSCPPASITSVVVENVYSLSNCCSGSFTDYIRYWRHNGYWLFNSPSVMRGIASEHNLDISGMTLFYYEVFERQFDHYDKIWTSFEPEPSFYTKVERPKSPHLEGYDVTTFNLGNAPECSPLSCNGLATEIRTNQHCLFETFEQATIALEEGRFLETEEGPFRIIAVFTLG